MKKVIFYVDGFNFYYGIHRAKESNPAWKRAYWIDFVKLFEQFLGDNQELAKVIYFTASPLNVGKSKRQSALLNANKLINGDRFEIVRGKYLDKQIQCPYCHATISRPEEKRTDVNISVRMISDAAKSAADVFCLVSADSDLITPLEYIADGFPAAIIKSYFPPTNFCAAIRAFLHNYRKRPILMEKSPYFFDRAKMPFDVARDGIIYSCPMAWR